MTTARPPFLDLPPLFSAQGQVRLPGSKSISNRVLLLAALCEGQTTVHDLLDSDDTRVMLDALQQLGCGVQREGDTAIIDGLGRQLKVHDAKLFLGNAGTAMRPLCAALAVLATLQGGAFHLHGVARMHERPIGDLVDALRQLGCDIQDLGTPGYPPLMLRGSAGGQLNIDAPIRVRGDVSSQFLTALLLALPLAAGSRAIEVEVVGELISKPYIDITLKLLGKFGLDVVRDGWERFTIPQGARLVSPGTVHVEGDASSASYFIALGALAATTHPLRIEGVGLTAIQGDIRFVDAARAMGADIHGGPNHLEVRRGQWPLKGIDLDCNHIPDAAMTLAMMALYADSPTRLRNIASWRVKETDRIAAMATELRKLGATVVEHADAIEIHPLKVWRSASIHTYDDHRMAMCFSLAALNGLSQPVPVSIRIEDPACTAKTYPHYFQDLFSVTTSDPRHVPVITIDGPTASGKGTLASRVAEALGYHLLDSGALYRATGWAATQAGVALDDGDAVGEVARHLPIRFEGERIHIGSTEVSDTIRQEAVGLMASRVSVHPQVRQALHDLQVSFRRAPGLVADGRDMGTVIFPDAPLKVFLTASAATRAERRYKQLIAKGISANIDSLRKDLEERDARDTQRSASPLKPAQDALLLDNSSMGIEESVQWVLAQWAQRRPVGTAV